MNHTCDHKNNVTVTRHNKIAQMDRNARMQEMSETRANRTNPRPTCIALHTTCFRWFHVRSSLFFVWTFHVVLHLVAVDKMLHIFHRSNDVHTSVDGLGSLCLLYWSVTTYFCRVAFTLWLCITDRPIYLTTQRGRCQIILGSMLSPLKDQEMRHEEHQRDTKVST